MASVLEPVEFSKDVNPNLFLKFSMLLFEKDLIVENDVEPINLDFLLHLLLPNQYSLVCVHFFVVLVLLYRVKEILFQICVQYDE